MGLREEADSERTCGPLDGIRVLDLSRVIMGPLATQILADQGADVIMLEAKDGDTNRVMGAGPHPELSGVALNLLRNKRSVVVDFKTDEGMDLVHRLVATCDVVVATMRPQVLTRLGLDYQSLERHRPGLIYCQGQGFPLASPRAEEPAYDDIIQAASGVCDVMTRVFDVPALLPTIFADKACALIIAQVVTAALFHRERTGQGQHVEVPMVQAIKAFMLVEHGSGAIAVNGDASTPYGGTGYVRVLSKERRAHPTADGVIHMQPYSPKHYAALFAAVGMDTASADHRYKDIRSTIQYSDELYREVRAACAQRTTQEWLDFCEEAQIPATRVETLENMVDELPVATHPVIGDFHLISQMANFSATPGGLRRMAPMIGQDNDEVVEELRQLERTASAVNDVAATS